MGCVLPAGQGQAPARQASLGAGLPLAAGCTTINKMCGSGMKAAMFAHDLLAAGTNDIMVAGGMESMTNAPYLMPKARAGYRMGHQQVLDHMFFDGLERTPTSKRGRLMGTFAEECAGKYQFTREEQDRFAIASLERAQKANKEGWFAWEITPIAIKAGKDEKFVENDEQPFKANIDKIPDAQARVPQGRHGDRGQLVVDLRRRGGAGADAPLDRREARAAAARGHRRPRTHAQEPALVHHRAGRRDPQALREDRLERGKVDLYEINEAFAVVTMAAMKEHDLPHEKVNVHGGACALGHPDRRLRRAHRGDADRRAAEVRRQARRREPVHRRRRSDGDGDRTGLERRTRTCIRNDRR